MRHEVRSADPVLVQVRPATEAGGLAAVFALNTGSQPVQRTYTLSDLGLSGPLHVYEWTADQPWIQPVNHLSLTLQPHDGVLLFLGPTPIMQAPERLP